MKHSNFNPFLLLLLLSTLSCIPIIVVFGNDESSRYEACRPKSHVCGNSSVVVGYPFRIEDWPDYCGHPKYYLHCDNKTSTLTIQISPGSVYKVLGIDYMNHIISLLDRDVDDDKFCNVLHRNINIDSSLYDFSGRDFILTVYFNCTKPSSSKSVYQITKCGNSYYKIGNSATDAPENCSSTSLVMMDMVAEQELENGNLVGAMHEGFSLKWQAGKGWCSNCTLSGGICGYSPVSSNHQLCYCSYGMVTGTCSPEKMSNKIKLGVGLGAGGVLILSLLFFFVYQRRRRQRRSSSGVLLRASSSEHSSKKDPEMGAALSLTQTFSYRELQEATDGFSEANELGDGGFGTVYKGVLRDGRTVAVKRLYQNNCKRLEQFMNEIEILSRLRHQNLVTLYGCSARQSRELLLVYEFLPNGTVADHLHGTLASERPLSWRIRMNIAIETAGALAYLHAIEPQIIHRDVKTTNILLDYAFHVKVGDFGLSRLFPVDATHVSTAPQGTPGYVDPEYHQCYQLTDKSDVYSFGVVLVELVSSKPAVDISRQRQEINLSNMAINKIQNNELDQLVDLELGFLTDMKVKRMITQVAELAFRCLQGERDLRPSIKEVLEALKKIDSNSGNNDNNSQTERSPENDRNLRNDAPLLKSVSPNSVQDWLNSTSSVSTAAVTTPSG